MHIFVLDMFCHIVVYILAMRFHIFVLDMFCHIVVYILAMRFPPYVISSLGMLSLPGYLPYFSILISFSTSNSSICSGSSLAVLLFPLNTFIKLLNTIWFNGIIIEYITIPILSMFLVVIRYHK